MRLQDRRFLLPQRQLRHQPTEPSGRALGIGAVSPATLSSFGLTLGAPTSTAAVESSTIEPQALQLYPGAAAAATALVQLYDNSAVPAIDTTVWGFVLKATTTPLTAPSQGVSHTAIPLSFVVEFFTRKRASSLRGSKGNKGKTAITTGPASTPGDQDPSWPSSPGRPGARCSDRPVRPVTSSIAVQLPGLPGKTYQLSVHFNICGFPPPVGVNVVRVQRLEKLCRRWAGSP